MEYQNCYKHAAGCYGNMFMDEASLNEVLGQFDELPQGAPMQAGDLGVRPGHVVIATGNGDLVSQAGFPEDILPAQNRIATLDHKVVRDKKKLTKEEQAEHKRLRAKIEKWEEQHKDRNPNTIVPLKALKQHRDDKYKIYRIKPEFKHKLTCARLSTRQPCGYIDGDPLLCPYCGKMHAGKVR